MRHLLGRFWSEEAAATYTMEIVLVATLIVIGVTVGLGRLRVAINDELNDLANALGSLNQSFIVPAGDVCGAGVFVAGSGFLDDVDHADCDQIDISDEVKDHSGTIDKADLSDSQG
jgi:Flp pilus assembly pilin Flp